MFIHKKIYIELFYLTKVLFVNKFVKSAKMSLHGDFFRFFSSFYFFVILVWLLIGRGGGRKFYFYYALYDN